MITRVSIQETQTLTTISGINDLVNAGKSKRIFEASFIQVGVVNTHSPRAILLQDKYWVSQPLRMEYFNDEPDS
jgi:hypothetical protein